MRFERPTKADDERFLIRLYFKRADDSLIQCIERAYLEFSRTMHGIGKIGDDGTCRKAATNMVGQLFGELRQLEQNANQQRFDQWHRGACDRLIELYAKHDYTLFVGQAQKWLNMTLKYIYVIGDLTNDHQLSGYERFYKLGHVPLDRIIIECFEKYPDRNPPRLTTDFWSRLTDYDEYLSYQKWVRDTFQGSPPLAVEFHLWLNPELIEG